MNYGTEKPIIIYTWKDNRLNQSNPKVLMRSMTNTFGDPQEDYNPETNAVNLAKLFTMSLPGNTLDEFYAAIVKEVKPLLSNPESLELCINDNRYLSNMIRIAVNQLLEKED